MHNGSTIEDILALVASKLPDLTLAEQLSAEEEAAAEEGALIEASGYPDPGSEVPR